MDEAAVRACPTRRKGFGAAATKGLPISAEFKPWTRTLRHAGGRWDRSLVHMKCKPLIDFSQRVVWVCNCVRP
eukprot:2480064-Alexandrium_andersonii.AAC.1